MSQTEENNEGENPHPEEKNENQNEGNIPPPPDLDDDEEEYSMESRVPNPSVIYRGSWGARAPRWEMDTLKLPVSEVLITFTGSEECTTNSECLDLVHLLQRRDMYDKGLPDIQYNFLIGGDTMVYEGRGVKYHADKSEEHKDLRGKSIDIAYIGDFRYSVPLKKVIRACAGVCQMLVEQGWVTNEFNLTPLAKSQPVWDKGDGCKGEECFMEGHEKVDWQKYPGFASLDQLLSKHLF